jgi:hypothetical protein
LRAVPGDVEVRDEDDGPVLRDLHLVHVCQRVVGPTAVTLYLRL